MKRILLSALLVAWSLTIFAQTDEEKSKLEDGKFKLKGVSGINMSQTSFSNWSAGGENAFAGNVFLNGSLLRKSGHWLWSNYLALDYGITNTRASGTQKASDKIDFSTQLGYAESDKWFYTIMGDFKSQFAKGYTYPDRTKYVSKFLAPAYSNISLGMEYRPNEQFSFYLSPIATKMTFVQDKTLSDAGEFGVDKGKTFRAEVGAYFKARGKKKVMTNVEAISSLDLFTGYEKSFGNVDVNWDLMIAMKINKYLSANLSTSLKYDDNIKTVDNDVARGPKVQFKEVLGIGLAYNF